MLRWRLSLGMLMIAALIGWCALDAHLPMPGTLLFPLTILLVLLAGGELLDLIEAGGLRPIRWAVHGGNLWVVSCCWGASVCCRFQLAHPSAVAIAIHPWSEAGLQCSAVAGFWTLLAFSIAVLLALAAGMRRFESPGDATAGVAATVFAISYVGLSFASMVLLRMAWGIQGLASLVIVVKAADTGAYTVGRLIGRNKMTPKLSPGKTIEGLIGGMAFAVTAAWLTFSQIGRDTTCWWGWLAFGLLLGAAGVVGDLAESLLKRNAGRKDSSRWMPGFGGVLDIFDSLLLAAPVAVALWALHLVGKP